MPMRARHAIHASADCTNIMPTMAGEVTKRRNERARRGPSMSQMKPVMARMTMLVETAAMLPWPICFLERLSDDSFFVRHERRRSEHREEGREEAPPRGVEGAVVRVGEVEEHELSGLVLGVDRNGELAAEDVGGALAVHAALLQGGVQEGYLLLELVDL